jgi:hypothetical protein
MLSVVMVLFATLAIATPTLAPKEFYWPATTTYKDLSPLPDGEVSHYMLYYTDTETEIPTDAKSINVGNVTSFLFADVPVDVNNKYFVFTTVLKTGMESDYSNQVHIVPFGSAVPASGSLGTR